MVLGLFSIAAQSSQCVLGLATDSDYRSKHPKFNQWQLANPEGMYVFVRGAVPMPKKLKAFINAM